MHHTTVNKEETYTILQNTHRIILEGDIAQAGAELVLDECLKTAAEKSNKELVIDLRRLCFINLAAIRSIIKFIVEHEQLKFLFIVSEYKTWQKLALHAILVLGNIRISSKT